MLPTHDTTALLDFLFLCTWPSREAGLSVQSILDSPGSYVVAKQLQEGPRGIRLLHQVRNWTSSLPEFCNGYFCYGVSVCSRLPLTSLAALQAGYSASELVACGGHLANPWSLAHAGYSLTVSIDKESWLIAVPCHWISWQMGMPKQLISFML